MASTNPSGAGPAFQGIGTDSVPAIKAAAAQSGLVPPLIDTNDYDPPPNGGGFHLTHNAVDWSNGGNAGTPQMDAFAQWVFNNYGSTTLELIHVNQDGTTPYLIKYGQPVDPSYYGASTLSQHHNHVHWAITLQGLSMAGNPAVVLPGSAVDTAAAGAATATDTGFDWDPLNWPGDLAASTAKSIVGPVVEFGIEAGMVIGGAVLLGTGLVLLLRTTSGGKAVENAAGYAALAAAA